MPDMGRGTDTNAHSRLLNFGGVVAVIAAFLLIGSGM